MTYTTAYKIWQDGRAQLAFAFECALSQSYDDAIFTQARQFATACAIVAKGE